MNLKAVPQPLCGRYSELRINAERMNATLQESCKWGNTPDGGMNRVTSNDDDKKVRDWFIEVTRECGCHHKIDQMGNIFAIRPGQNNNLAPIAIGSHLDTQPKGGKYDGILGICCGIEVLRVLHENNVSTYAPFAVVDWTNEEGARFPPAMLGSGVWAGEFTVDYALSRPDDSGATMGDELRRIGYAGSTPCAYESVPLLAHLECHIEQGTKLEQSNLPVGVVKGIQTIGWYHITLSGKESHCGSTPMEVRHDALLTAARMIVAVKDIISQNEHQEEGSKATVAVIHSSPQSINTIAGTVTISLDLRCRTDDLMTKLEHIMRTAFEKISLQDGVGMRMVQSWLSKGVKFHQDVFQCIQDAAATVGCHEILTSSVGHDSVYTSKRIPTGMLFTRCRNGVSHSPEEYSTPEDCAKSAEVMLGAYLRFDQLICSRNE